MIFRAAAIGVTKIMPLSEAELAYLSERRLARLEPAVRSATCT